jgi:hypothetical protein
MLDAAAPQRHCGKNGVSELLSVKLRKDADDPGSDELFAK